MAYENIQLEQDNFCMGPQDGTVCTLDTSDVTSVLRTKNLTGGIISDYALSSNIVDDVVGIDYVGPKELTAVVDDLVFFTLERVNSTTCVLKKWETNIGYSMLDLKAQTTYTTIGHYYFDALALAVEHYERSFSANIGSYQNYVDIDDSDYLEVGMSLFLGPSNDPDNDGATETVTISYISGTRVYLTSNLTYQYIIGDSITFYNNAYIISNKGYDGDATKGAIFTINLRTGSITNASFDGVYQRTTAARWCSFSQAVGIICNTNLLFVRPYNFYLNWKSLFMNNIESDKATVYEIYDVIFDDYTVYKLTDKVVKRNDDGSLSQYNWSDYNYIQDSLLPYAYSIKLVSEDLHMIAANDDTDIEVQVRDQFGVSLTGVDINVDVDSGDTGATLDPLNGQGTTDINGKVTIGYESGTEYEGHTVVTCNSENGSAASTGSAFVWSEFNILSIIDADPVTTVIFYPVDPITFDTEIIRQISDTFSISTTLFPKTFFTNPGGNWVDSSEYSSDVHTYLPALVDIGPGDGPNDEASVGGVGFSGWPLPHNWPTSTLPMPNRITQILEFDSEQQQFQISDNFSVDFERQKQIGSGSNDLQLSQINLSKHTHWVAGQAYDTLWTYVTFDQFVFVDDAIPQFWSEKNPIETTIWLRLRPFAFSLNGSTLVFKVREVSYAGDTGYVNVTDQVSITYFDAGGGTLGMELLYTPSQDFHHNGIVYVHLEVYDIASTPNLIYLDYWFMLIPDYRFPYLDNQDPASEETNVPVDTTIYFEVKDNGVGVDIDTLEVTLNSRIATPQSIVRISDNQYNVTYTPTSNLYFGKEYIVNVKVRDLSENRNYMNLHYRFFTAESDAVMFEVVEPMACRWGFPLFQDVSFLALGAGSGVDRDTLRLQVHNYDVTDKTTILPVIYRIS